MDKVTTAFENINKNLSQFIDYVIIVRCGEKYTTYNSIEKSYIEFIQTQSLRNIKKTLDICDKYYYNTITPIVNDSVYDLISDYYYKTSDKDKSDKIGASVKTRKVKLPIHMGSMDKVKLGQPVLASFLKNYTHNKFISSKLDGISLLIGKYNNNSFAYTRGNGEYGQDASRFLNYIKTTKNESLHHILCNVDNNTFIRGELIISKKNWCTFSHLGSNARNMAMGIINRKTVTKEIEICTFLGYQFISDEKLSISEQFARISSLNIDTPDNKLYKNTEISEDTLPNILEKYKNTSEYEIDGIIIQDDIYYPINTEKNPKYAKAFKMEKYNESGISIIKNIEWNVVKNGNLKPVLIIEPIQLSDVVIKRIYAYHAKYIQDNKIGCGAAVEIIRSGDVIPKVKRVIKGVFNKDVDLPKVYKWNMNKLDIMVTDIATNKEVLLSQSEYFVKTIGIEFCKKSTLRKLYETGVKTVNNIISINDINTLLKVKGLKDKSAAKIFKSIRGKLSNVGEALFIASLPIYNGISQKRIKLIIRNIPAFYMLEKKEVYDKLLKIKGFSDKISKIIVNELDACREYIEFYKKYYGAFTVSETIKSKKGKYTNRRFCFSGIRDKNLEKGIISEGGEILTSFDANVTDLIVKNPMALTNKIKRAQKLKINIIEHRHFIL